MPCFRERGLPSCNNRKIIEVIAMNKLKMLIPAIGFGSVASFAAAPTYSDASTAIAAIGETASSAFGTFSDTIVPMLLGALVVVGGLTLGKWVIKKIRA